MDKKSGKPLTIKRLTKLVNSPGADLSATILDSLIAVPMGGIFVAVYKIGVGVSDFLLCRKFAHFLNPMSGMEDRVEDYLEQMQPEVREKLAEYLLSLLSNAESTDKALLMGYVFKSAVHKEIDREMMLRLVSIIGRSFVSDLKVLPRYLEASIEFTISTNELVNLGLIDNDTGGYWKSTPTVALNEVGRTLCGILQKEGWLTKE